MHVTWIASLRDLEPGRWDALAERGGFYLSAPWLSWQEDDQGTTRRYLLVMDGGSPVVATPVDFVDDEPNDFYRLDHMLPDSWTEPGQPLMVVGGHAGYRSGLAADPRVAPARMRDAVSLMLDELACEARATNRAAVWCYLQDTHLDSLPENLRRQALLACHEATIHLGPQGWQGYLDARPSKRRREIAREFRRFSEHGYEIAVGTLLPEVDRAGVLLACVQRKYGHAADAAATGRFLARQLRAADSHVAFKCYADGTLIGFALAYPHGETLYMRAVGFSYESLAGRAEYFGLTYYLPIQWAARHGLTALHLGTQALEPKVQRGAELSALWHVPIGWSWTDAASVAHVNRVRRHAGT